VNPTFLFTIKYTKDFLPGIQVGNDHMKMKSSEISFFFFRPFLAHLMKAVGNFFSTKSLN